MLQTHVVADHHLAKMNKEEVIDILYEISDPEIKINIYDLGMIYNIDVEENLVKLDITLTSAGCPLAEELEDMISKEFAKKNMSVALNWVWSPNWTIDRITPEGKDQLVAIGFPMKLLEKSTWKKREKSDFNE